MTLLAGSNWRDYFDVIIVQARKPKFFTDESRPIRLYDEKTNTHVWDRVSKLERGKIYYEVRSFAINPFGPFFYLLFFLFLILRVQLNNFKS